MSAYRGGPNTFTVICLSSKPLHLYGKPTYNCCWVLTTPPNPHLRPGYKILPDWGYDRVYTVVVVNCTFPATVDGGGGHLFVDADADTILALNETPQRMWEWVAYHVRLFRPRDHFVIHDADGVHEGLMDVLRPWVELGFVTVQDIREQEGYDGYYHNQFCHSFRVD